MYNNDDSFGVGYALGRDANNNNNGNGNGMFGNDWFAWIIILLIFGWGGNGFGGFGNGGGFMNGALTRGDLCQDMNFNNLEGAVRGISNGICDSTFALNNTMTNGFASVQSTLCQGFGGVNTAITTNGYETRGAISDLGYRLQDCCCQELRAIDGVNFNMAQNTCAITNTLNANTRDIIQSQQAGTQRILDYLCQEKISGLQAENAALTNQLSQNAQTASIVNQLRPCPIPAYITCSPYESSYGFGYGRNGYGNNGCGCNSGCCGCNG